MSTRLGNLLSLVLGDTGGRLLALAATAWVARVLGMDGFGTIAVSTAVVTLGALVVTFGFDAYGTREIARTPEALGRRVASLLVLRLLFALGVYVLLAVLVLVLPVAPALRGVVLVHGLTLVATAASVGWALQGLERMRVVAGAGLVNQVVFAAWVFGLVRGPGDLTRVAAGYVAAEALATAVLLAGLVRHARVRLVLDTSLWSDAVREAAPIFVGRALRGVGLTFDVLALQWLLDSGVAGVYSAATGIIRFLANFNVLYLANLYPMLVRAAQWEPAARAALLRSSLRLTFAVALPVAAAGAVLAGETIELVFGEEYGASATPLRLLSGGLAVMMVAGHYRTVLLAFGEQRADARAVGWGTALNVGLNLAFVPIVGPRGAAAAFVASESLVLLLAHRAFRRRVLDEPRLPGLGAGLAGAAVVAFVLVAAGGLALPARLAVAAGACGAAVVAASGPNAIRSAWERLFGHS